MIKTALAVIGGLLLIGALGFILSYYSFSMDSFFAPKYTALNSKIYKESVQYNEGMQRDLENLELEYQRSDTAGKSALRPIIIHRFEIYDERRLSPNLRNFYDSIRNQGIN